MPLMSQEQIAFINGIDPKDLPESIKKKHPTLIQLGLDSPEKIAKKWGVKTEKLPDFLKKLPKRNENIQETKTNKDKIDLDLIFKIILIIGFIVFVIWLLNNSECEMITTGPYAGYSDCDIPHYKVGPVEY